jgi:hypothetical protein
MGKLISVLGLLLAIGSNNFASAAEEAVSLPCIDESGALKNADPANVCKAMLPKCSVLKKKLVDQLKNMMEWKIYGYYYLNKDIKLDKISGMKDGNVADGEPLPYPICSVVGHSLSANESGEIEKQSIAGGRSCGDLPIFQNGSSWNYKVKIQYDGEKGKRWFSYVLGAYPWEIRRKSSDVITQLDNNLSNLGQVINTKAMTNDIKATLELMKKANLSLSAQSKNICNQPTDKNIVDSCMSGTLAVTDPVQKLCTLAKAQNALNEVSLPNMLVYEVMDRTKKMHEELFGNIFNADANSYFKSLIDHCSDTGSWMTTVSSILNPMAILGNAIKANKAYSCNTSCMTDGEEWYTNTTDGDAISWKNSGGGSQRKCKKKAYFNIVDGVPRSSMSTLLESESWTDYVWNAGGWFDAVIKGTETKNIESDLNIGESQKTNSNGFAGMVEMIIRRKICNQTGSKTDKNVCDDVGIKDKPAEK